MRKNLFSLFIGAAIGAVIGVMGIYSRQGITVLANEAERSVSYPIVEEIEIREITDGERDLLAAIVFAEAGNQDFDGMRYVVDVVLNRVDDPRFPEDVTRVIFQPGQFWTAGIKGSFSEIPEKCYEAVDAELAEQLNYEILYFRTGHFHEFATDVMKHGDHYFSK